MERITAPASGGRYAMLPRGMVGLTTALSAESVKRHIAAHPTERAWIELAIERGDLTLRSEKEGEKKE